MFICLLVLYILGWLTRYLNLDTSLVYISKWEYTLCCVWHLSWTWSVPNIRIHLKLDSSFWIRVSAFINHIHIWEWNTSLSCFWDNKHPRLPWQLNSNPFCIPIWIFINHSMCFYISSKGKQRCIPLSYMNMIYKCRYSYSEAWIQFKVYSNIWNHFMSISSVTRSIMCTPI